ncbi:MAG TPA: aldehyde dehydrogenase family protein, partial [Thermoanaerobaculia bacterium]|nr:aldehyde dehydrogenase family protein [Thermoanaerobaculia bacterium]
TGTYTLALFLFAPAWGALPLQTRVDALKRWRDEVLDDPAVVATLVAESGKPRQEAEGVEILYFCELIHFSARAARTALREETRHPLLFLTKKTRLVRRPLGVVGVIGPWNFPILNNAADAVAPLLSGNAVILKPSDVTPLTSLRLAELWRKAGNPPGVFQIVTGRGSTGAALVERVDGVMFTGSVATGRKVAARAAERLVPCVTELGGKSPFIVLASANLERAAEAAAWSSYVHSGQACIRTERIYVEESVADRFEELLAGRVRALRQAPPEAPPPGGHDLGAVTFSRQLDVVKRHLADAVARGARVVSGGKGREDLGGCFFEPTLLLGATQEMAVMREETFGPLVAVMRVKDAGEALRLANDTHLGLNATVFGAPEEAMALARRLESGQVIVNDALVNYIVVEAPLGGWKESGLGVRHGVEGVRQWTRTQAITVRRPLLAPIERLIARFLAFPYDPRVLAVLRRATRLLYRRGLSAKLGPPPKDRGP